MLHIFIARFSYELLSSGLCWKGLFEWAPNEYFSHDRGSSQSTRLPSEDDDAQGSVEASSLNHPLLSGSAFGSLQEMGTDEMQSSMQE